MMTKADLEDQASQLQNAENDAKRATADSARLADELRQEKDRCMLNDKLRRALESQVYLTYFSAKKPVFFN